MRYNFETHGEAFNLPSTFWQDSSNERRTEEEKKRFLRKACEIKVKELYISQYSYPDRVMHLAFHCDDKGYFESVQDEFAEHLCSLEELYHELHKEWPFYMSAEQIEQFYI